METKKLAMLVAQPPAHPLDVAPQYVVLSSQHLGWPGITVWHHQSPPLEIYAPPLSQHEVFVQLNSGPRLVQQRNGRHADGKWHTWEVLIARAEQPGYWRAEGTVDNVHLDLEPHFLQHMALTACEMDPARVELQDIFGTRDYVIKHIGLALLAELKTAGLGGALYAASLANILAIHILRTYCVHVPVLRHYKGSLPKYKLRLVLAYINDYLNQQITLGDLAALVHLDQYHFLRTFRQSTGCTPHQYVIERRIEWAKVLLKDPAVPITEVALQTGFRTLSHFTMHFRRRTGLTPTAYRQAML